MAETGNQDRAERYSDVLFAEDNEYARLAALSNELDENTFRRLSGLNPEPTWRCLELGAGTGSVVRWLARKCPAGRVVAADINLRYLTGISESNVEVVKHDVTVDDFPEGSFDLIHARYLFCHLPTRHRDLPRVAKWLAPGGWLVLEDPAEFPVDSSPDPDYRQVNQAMGRALADRIGSDFHWPRSYPGPLAALGLERLGSDVSVAGVGAGCALTNFVARTIRQLTPPMLEAGLSDEPQIERVLKLIARDDFHDLWYATMAAWGRRP